MNRLLGSTIGFRLILALVALATIGLGTAAIALWTFDRYGRAAEEIAATETRRLAGVARFTEIATGLRAEMPRLVFAETEQAKLAARERLEARIDALASLLRQLNLPRLPSYEDDGVEFGEELRARLRAIDSNVSARIEIRKEVARRVELLRQQHGYFLREIKPLLTNAAFNIQAALRRLGPQHEASENAPIDIVRQELSVSDTLARIHAHINLILGKMLEAAAEKRGSEIERIRIALVEAVATTAPLRDLLRSSPHAEAVNIVWHDIESQIVATPGLIDHKLREAALSEQGEQLIAGADKTLNDLADLVARTVLTSSEVSVAAAQGAREAINRGTLLILGLGGANAIVSFLVGWFYVGRRFISRLSALLAAMRGIAAGDLKTPVAVVGKDEVGLLADALRTLQMRSQLAHERRLALAAANDRLSLEIAERRAAQRELERTQEELLQAGKLAAIGQVSTGIAHELNQPLAAMRSYLHNTRRYLDSDNREKVVEKLDQMESLLSRMAGISKHLKTLARRSTPTIERCCAGAIAERAAALFENRIAESGIRLKMAPYSCATYVQADPNRLEQVFINLLSNALDAVEGQADAVVTVRVASAKGMQRILIADNGPGIPPSQQDHLFDPFYTTKPPGAGLGLGLTIAFNIIQDFKGRLTIRNRRNGGAAAIVSLRIAPPAEAGGTRGDI